MPPDLLAWVDFEIGEPLAHFIFSCHTISNPSYISTGSFSEEKVASLKRIPCLVIRISSNLSASLDFSRSKDSNHVKRQ